MPNATDYWLQGLQVANERNRNDVSRNQKNRDYAARNKLYYGEDWRGDEKGDTDFGASEAARKQRLDEDALAAAEVYLGSPGGSKVVDPRTVPGMSEADSDFGLTNATTLTPQPDAPRLVPVTNDLGSPSAVPATPVRVITPPELVNTDSAADPNWNFDEMGPDPRARVSTTPVVQPDAPRYIPVENTMGAPAAVTPAPAAVPVPDLTGDLGASLAPAAKATSVVPSTSNFGAPLGQPTAREIFDRTDPSIRDKPSFRTALAAYEKDRLTKVSRFSQAEELANIRMLGALQQSLIRGEMSAGLEGIKQKGRETLKEKDIEGRSDLEDKKQEGRTELAQLREANRQLVASGKPPVLDKATEREVSELGSAIGKKVVVSNSLENQAKQMEDTALDPALRLAAAKGSLKTLNSAEGRDAVGKEEAERIGGLLKINLNLSDFILGRPIAPDLKLFTEQVKNKAEALGNDVVDARKRVKEIYAPYGYDPERPRTAEAQMRSSGITPQSTGTITNATSSQPVKVNSQREYDALPKGTQYMDSNGKLATKR